MDRAVALRYDDRTPAPFVLANEKGELAKKLVGLAKEYGVPVTSESDLENKLILLQPGTMIPDELFGPIAEIFALIMKLEPELYEKDTNR